MEIQIHNELNILMQSPAYQDDQNKLYNVVLSSAARAYTQLNFSIPSKDEMDIMINDICASINDRKELKKIRIDEIPTAFANGIRREYGDFMGLSVITFEFFIEKYLESDQRKELAKQHMRLLQSPAHKNIELTRDDRIAFAKKAFEEFTENGSYFDHGNIVYDFLDKSEKMFNLSNDEKWALVQQEREAEYNKLQYATSLAEKKRFDDRMQKLMEGNDSIIPNVKRKVLNEFFQKLLDNGQQLEFSNAQSSHQ